MDVYSGTFTMRGGEISGNTASNGAALYKESSAHAYYGGTEQRPLIPGNQSTDLYTDSPLYGAVYNN